MSQKRYSPGSRVRVPDGPPGIPGGYAGSFRYPLACGVAGRPHSDPEVRTAPGRPERDQLSESVALNRGPRHHSRKLGGENASPLPAEPAIDQSSKQGLYPKSSKQVFRMVVAASLTGRIHLPFALRAFPKSMHSSVPSSQHKPHQVSTWFL